jgi:hypothetical protein
MQEEYIGGSCSEAFQGQKHKILSEKITKQKEQGMWLKW